VFENCVFENINLYIGTHLGIETIVDVTANYDGVDFVLEAASFFVNGCRSFCCAWLQVYVFCMCDQMGSVTMMCFFIARSANPIQMTENCSNIRLKVSTRDGPAGQGQPPI
jgi:hypothetical protein